MCEGFRIHISLRPLLNKIVSDSLSGLKALFYISRLQEVLPSRMVAPNSGKAIGLQFLDNGKRIRFCLVRPAPHRVDLIGDPQQVLDMMAHFMSDDVSLSKIAGRSEAPVELLEEREVQIHLPIGRAIKRSDCRRG